MFCSSSVFLSLQLKVEEAKQTSVAINLAREGYRPAATRGALLYFLVDALWVLDSMYQYSMANYVTILKKVQRLISSHACQKRRERRQRA